MNKWEEPAFGRAFPQSAIRVMEYNYAEPYEGHGAAIAQDPNTLEFLVSEYGHCSCDGPDEAMTMYNRYDNLIDAVRGVSTWYRKDLLKAFEKEVG